MNDLIITNARLIDGTGSQPRDNVTITVRGGRIEAVRAGGEQTDGEGADVIDVGGRTLLPGLINAHCHVTMNAGADPFAYTKNTSLPTLLLHSLKRCQQMLEAGITTARDLGGYEYVEMALRDAFAAGDWPGP
ncbi:MAG TPA: amidohydrolase family protein, partial [Chloroflexia bacterium]